MNWWRILVWGSCTYSHTTPHNRCSQGTWTVKTLGCKPLFCWDQLTTGCNFSRWTCSAAWICRNSKRHGQSAPRSFHQFMQNWLTCTSWSSLHYFGVGRSPPPPSPAHHKGSRSTNQWTSHSIAFREETVHFWKTYVAIFPLRKLQILIYLHPNSST